MFDFLKLFLSFIFLFFLPGFSILYLILRVKARISSLEFFVLSVGTSIVAINSGVLFLDRLNIALNSSNLITAIFLLITLPLVVSTFPSLKVNPAKKEKELAQKNNKEQKASMKKVWQVS